MGEDPTRGKNVGGLTLLGIAGPRAEVLRDADGNGDHGDDVVQHVKWQSGCRLSETALLIKQDVEVGVKAEHDGERSSGEFRLPGEQRSDAADARRRACAVPPSEVERR